MSRDIDMHGMAEFAAVLSAFPKNLQNNAVRGGLRAGAKPIRDLARTLAPKETGEMAAGINYSDPRRQEEGLYSVRIEAGGRHGFLALLNEYGTSPHMITISDQAASQIEARLGPAKNSRKRSTVTRWGNRMVEDETLKIGENFIGPIVQHPGSRAHPFMRPALDGAADDAVLAFATYVQNFVQNKSGFTPTGMAA
jgi:HK97 gp10 family phage protein